MKERPIIFSGPMVRAILEGRKTQTRRVVKPNNSTVLGQPSKPFWPGLKFEHAEPRAKSSMMVTICAMSGQEEVPDDLHLSVPWLHEDDKDKGEEYWGWYRVRPKYEAGDRLWVRETWQLYEALSTETEGDLHLGALPAVDEENLAFWKRRVAYRETEDTGGPWRSPIHMPRWASRITLEVTDVRVERVQDISEESASNEGVDTPQCQRCGYTLWDAQFHMDHRLCPNPNPASAIPVFSALWDSINAKRGFGWDANPWVWVIEFALLKIARVEP